MAAPCTGQRWRGNVARSERVGADGCRIDVAIRGGIDQVRPSQFFMLRRGDGAGPLLARPFSLYLQKRADGADELSFLLKIHGPGTRSLAELGPGDGVELVGPLGNGFPQIARGEKIVCIAGGVGIATFPLVFETAIAEGASPGDLTLCFGSARADLLYESERYKEYGIRVLLATDDGSAGARGNSLDLLKSEMASGAIVHKVFACGPERMLEAVARYCLKQQISCFLSLETRMGCGTGVCNACAVPVKPRSNGGWPVAKACREGPVFDARNLVLEERHQF
ncbi:MAG: dihydroorotate dehydrogenase electron transfer subunit [Planctomycetes bacterium]|nr:dihydroorotate dehydrogenase electron transfer subunit [Planctomycetota bacterium]